MTWGFYYCLHCQGKKRSNGNLWIYDGDTIIKCCEKPECQEKEKQLSELKNKKAKNDNHFQKGNLTKKQEFLVEDDVLWAEKIAGKSCWGRYNSNIPIKGKCGKCQTSNEVIFEPGLKSPIELIKNRYCLDCYINNDVLEGCGRKPILAKIYGFKAYEEFASQKIKNQKRESEELEPIKEQSFEIQDLKLQLEEEKEKNKILTEKARKLENELLELNEWKIRFDYQKLFDASYNSLNEEGKKKLDKLIQTIENVIREGKENDYFAQELIIERKEVLKEKLKISTIEKIYRLKKELVKLEIQQNQQLEALVEVLPNLKV